LGKPGGAGGSFCEDMVGIGEWSCQWQGRVLSEGSLAVAGGPSLHLLDVCKRMLKEQGQGFQLDVNWGANDSCEWSKAKNRHYK
jgi:hypothetical protein